MTQRSWLITGVGTGFGRIMTEQLLARGDRVAGTVHDLAGCPCGSGSRPGDALVRNG